jgi:hypothetical protein
MRHVWGKGETYIGFWWGNMKKREYSTHLDVMFEDHITMQFQDIRCAGLDWIDLAQDRDKWRTVVNKSMKLRVPYGRGDFLIN